MARTGHVPQRPPNGPKGFILLEGWPDRGWEWVSMSRGVKRPCLFCGQTIVFSHRIKYPFLYVAGWGSEVANVGLSCAEYLTGDYAGPRKKEKAFKDKWYREHPGGEGRSPEPLSKSPSFLEIALTTEKEFFADLEKRTQDDILYR